MNRKEYPVYSGFIKYFPDAIEEVSHVSFVGNEQHNPGQPLRWDRTKSTDEPDAGMRHTLDHARDNKFDTDGLRHLAKKAWRAMAELQKAIEEDEQVEREEPETLAKARREAEALDEEGNFTDEYDPDVSIVAQEQARQEKNKQARARNAAKKFTSANVVWTAMQKYDVQRP